MLKAQEEKGDLQKKQSAEGSVKITGDIKFPSFSRASSFRPRGSASPSPSASASPILRGSASPSDPAAIPAANSLGVVTEAKLPKKVCENAESQVGSGSRTEDKAGIVGGSASSPRISPSRSCSEEGRLRQQAFMEAEKQRQDEFAKRDQDYIKKNRFISDLTTCVSFIFSALVRRDSELPIEVVDTDKLSKKSAGKSKPTIGFNGDIVDMTRIADGAESIFENVSRLEAIAQKDPSHAELDNLLIEAQQIARDIFVDVLKRVPGMELCNELIDFASGCGPYIFLSTITLVNAYKNGIFYLLETTPPSEKAGKQLANEIFIYILNTLGKERLSIELINFVDKCQKCTSIGDKARQCVNGMFERILTPSVELIDLVDSYLGDGSMKEEDRKFANGIFIHILKSLAEKKPSIELTYLVYKCLICTSTNEEVKCSAKDIFMTVLKCIAKEEPSVDFIDRDSLDEDVKKFVDELFSFPVANPSETSIEERNLSGGSSVSTEDVINDECFFDTSDPGIKLSSAIRAWFLYIVTFPMRLLHRVCYALSDSFAINEKLFAKQSANPVPSPCVENKKAPNLDSSHKSRFVGCGWMSICKSIILEHEPREVAKKVSPVAPTLPFPEFCPNDMSQKKEEVSAFPSSRCCSYY